MSFIIRALKKIIPNQFYPESYLKNLIIKETYYKILSGPFKNLNYKTDTESVGSAYWPKLIGTYEKELNIIIEGVLAKNPQLIDGVVNIGAAEGYYAVGLAQRLKNVYVTAFESQLQGQKLIRSLAELNHVSDKITIFGTCKHQSLNQSLLQFSHPLIICDIEGFEITLLDPNLVDFSKSYLLVEIHNFIDNRIGQTLYERFRSTHEIEQIWSTPRTREDFPFKNLYINLLPFNYLNVFLNEHRPCTMHWYFMTPK